MELLNFDLQVSPLGRLQSTGRRDDVKKWNFPEQVKYVVNFGLTYGLVW